MSVEFLDTEQVSYDVQADTLMAAAETFSQMDEAAKTEWFPRYDYQTTGNELSNATITVGTRITMPHWSGYSSASQAEKDEWDRFFAALQAHEQGHLDLVMQHLDHVDEPLVGKSVDGAAQVWQSALAALLSASRAYDGQTDHGRNQGTIIDVSVGAPEIDS
ncbi:MAG: DUF922 domain-containing protein [Anaerolineae bacterium]